MFQQIIDDLIGTPSGPEEREKSASRLIETCGYAAAAATLLPIPGSEIVAVMPIHVGMIIGLSQVYGIDMSRETALELLTRIGTTVGVSFVTTRVATLFAKIALPGLGGFVGAPLIFASTLAIGAVARTFLSREGEVSSEEMKDIYKQTVRDAKSHFDPSKMRAKDMQDLAGKAAEGDTPDKPAEPDDSGDLASRLTKLKELLDAGLLSEDEYNTERQRIIASI